MIQSREILEIVTTSDRQHQALNRFLFKNDIIPLEGGITHYSKKTNFFHIEDKEKLNNFIKWFSTEEEPKENEFVKIMTIDNRDGLKGQLIEKSWNGDCRVKTDTNIINIRIEFLYKI
jgi:hypothetical protein